MSSLHQQNKTFGSRQLVARLREVGSSAPGKIELTRWLAQAWHWRMPAAGAVGLAGLLWYFGLPFLLGPVVPVDPVIRADLVQSVVASGRVEAEFRVNIGSQITGMVKDIPVAEASRSRLATS